MRNFDNYIRIMCGGRPESCDMNGHCTCYFVVEGDGSVYPCDFYVLDQYKLGNVNENSFGEMYVCQTAKDFINQSIHKNSQCLQCKWLNICRGGCRRYREPFIDGKPGVNKFCSSYKKFFENNISKLYEIALIVDQQGKGM